MWFNPIIAFILKSPLHGILSKNIMLLSWQGRKSGRWYSTPVNYLEIDNELWTISSRDRTWWRNLRAGGTVSIFLRGCQKESWGEVIEEKERVAGALSRYLEKSPQIAKYIGIEVSADGKPNPSQLEKVAQERVMVKFKV